MASRVNKAPAGRRQLPRAGIQSQANTAAQIFDEADPPPIRRAKIPRNTAATSHQLGNAIDELANDNIPDAVRLFGEAIRHFPADADMRWAYALTIMAEFRSYTGKLGKSDLEAVIALLEGFQELTNQPDHRALLMRYMGNALYQLGRLERSVGHLLKALSLYKAAEDLLVTKPSPPPAATLLIYKLNIATTVTELSKLDPPQFLGQLQEVESELDSIAGENGSLSGLSSEWPRARLILGNAQRLLASIQSRSDILDRALNTYSSIIQTSTKDAIVLAETHLNMADIYNSLSIRDYDSAIKYAALALNIFSLSDDAFGQARAHHTLGSAHLNLGASEEKPVQDFQRQHLNEAVALFLKALRVQTADSAPAEWAETQYLLGLTFDFLEELEHAATAYRASFTHMSQRGPLEATKIRIRLAKVSRVDKGSCSEIVGLLSDARRLTDNQDFINIISDTAMGIALDIVKKFGVEFLLTDSSLLLDLCNLFVAYIDVHHKYEIHSRLSDFLTSLGISSPNVRQRLEERLMPIIEAATSDQSPLATTERSAFGAARQVKPEPTIDVEWPTETYSGSPEAKRGGGGIVAYLERVWLPFIRAGMVSRPILRHIDPSADRGVANYLYNGKARLPEHVDIPTKTDLITREAELAPDSRSRSVRLDAAIRSREYRKKKKKNAARLST